MSTTSAIPFSASPIVPNPMRPLLQHGDCLSAEEFERRYHLMPDVKKAELIGGIVYMPSPVSLDDHGSPHLDMGTWLGTYKAFTFGVRGGDNSTVRLNPKNRPQPDLLLIITPECGGLTTLTDGYVTGPPEHVDEISASSANYDLHQKLNEYHAAGIPEYVVWRVWDQAIDWFVRDQAAYRKIEADHGLYRSQVFPGLWLDADAMIAGDLARVLAVLQHGIATPEHAAFCAKLKQRSGE